MDMSCHLVKRHHDVHALQEDRVGMVILQCLLDNADTVSYNHDLRHDARSTTRVKPFTSLELDKCRHCLDRLSHAVMNHDSFHAPLPTMFCRKTA
jgi:hypothetical protein